MKTGIGIVRCGNCQQMNVVFWPGHKCKVHCQNCGKSMSIHRQRLQKFQEVRVAPREGCVG